MGCREDYQCPHTLCSVRGPRPQALLVPQSGTSRPRETVSCCLADLPTPGFVVPPPKRLSAGAQLWSWGWLCLPSPDCSSSAFPLPKLVLILFFCSSCLVSLCLLRRHGDWRDSVGLGRRVLLHLKGKVAFVFVCAYLDLCGQKTLLTKQPHFVILALCKMEGFITSVFLTAQRSLNLWVCRSSVHTS